MASPEKKIWHEYTPPSGQTRIEGTDEVPLVTDQPVEIVPRVPKRKAELPEQLFDMEKAQKTSRSPRSKPTKRPFRARFRDSTDYSVREERSVLESKSPSVSNPDADIDAIFGADSARRIVE